MKKYVWLIVILILGAWLRFSRLTTVPPSLSHDEVAIAYNAYSILKTGKDEYGKAFPVLFRSFDDYKLPGMVYTTVPFVLLFGRSELAARLPSAIFGVLALFALYLLAGELLDKNRYVTIKKIKIDIALFPTFMLAIQPWHINFSRQLFESNGATFFFILGTYFLVRSLKQFSAMLWAGVFYVVSLYFYYSVRLVIPFMLLLYVLLQWRVLMKNWKFFSVSVIICLVLFIPLGKEMLSPGGLARINTVSVVNDPNFIARKEEYTKHIAAAPSVLNKIIYNRRVAFVETVIENYWKNIAPHNLFMTGTGTYGALYPFESVLLIFGILALLYLHKFSRLVVITWLVSGFLPGAFSVNQPNTLRTLVVAPAFAILSGLGLWYILSKSSTWRYGVQTFLFIASVTFFLSFQAFLYAYFVNSPNNNALSFGDGYKQMIEYVQKYEASYDRIYISGYYWRPYIFMLYWGNTDPAVYQNGGTRDHFGKYYFTSASWDTSGIKLMDTNFNFSTLQTDKNTLFILSVPEYRLHRAEFTKLSDIRGINAGIVFEATRLKN